MAIPNPNPNIADGYKSDNKTYSSNKIESLITMATELPVPAAGDAGKVLTVNAGADGYELDTPVAPESIIDDSAAAADKVYSSSKVDTLLSGKASATVDTASGGTTFALNDKYSIPAEILAHTFITITLKRQGKGNTITMPVSELAGYDNGIGFIVSATEYYVIKVVVEDSATKLQLITIQGLNEPYINVVGFM